jgi:hypothetical protein
MLVKQWIAYLKSVRARSRKTSPRTMQIAAVSVVVMLAVAGIVLVAHQAASSTPPVAAAKAKDLSATAPAPARKAPLVKGKTANGATSAQAAEIVTIAGCLEQNHDAFRLKDTRGVDAPKSRNWKTLGMTKHASTVTVVDGANRLKLGSHVGERVSVTGPLVDKEMQGRSLKKLDASCD